MTEGPQGKKALLIGIDNYPAFGSEEQLDGAVEDATALAELLVERLGFPAGDVELLTNAEATREGIVSALGRLLERTEPDDVVVVVTEPARTGLSGREVLRPSRERGVAVIQRMPRAVRFRPEVRSDAATSSQGGDRDDTGAG